MQRTSESQVGLPVQLTPFIGREAECHELMQLLATSRLLTITGAGGSGKTRLALAVAQRMADTQCGPVRWVELAPLGRGDLLAQHITSQLQAPDASGRDALELLLEAVRPIRLLILDNCEHVIDDCARLVEILLRQHADLTILATSREALGIEGEQAWLLRGLEVDAPAEQFQNAPQSDAFRFFVNRARSASPSLQLTPANSTAIQDICRRVDGLPLAIELAASRVGVLTPEQIASRLDDMYALLTSRSRTALPRHKTLRAAIDWSYRLISSAERELLLRLSVFAGSFSLEAVEYVCQAGSLEREDVLELLAGLVTRSLVAMHEVGGTARYRLLEVIRQFAAEQLAQAPGEPDQQQRRHALYYAAMAEQVRPHLERFRSDALTAGLALDYDNLRSALQWSFEEGDRAIGIRLAAALLPFFGWSEAKVWLAEALRGAEPPDSPEWGQVLYGAGFIECVHGDRRRGREMLVRAAGVLERAGDRVHESVTRTSLARLLCGEDEFEAALASAERAAAIARTLEDSWPLCQAMSNGLAHTHMRLGNHDIAEAYLCEALEKARIEGRNHLGIVAVTRTRAAVALDRGDRPAAVQHSQAAIEAIQDLQDPYQAMRVLLLLERVLWRLARHSAAARVSGTIQAVHADGIPGLPDELWWHRQTVELLRQALGPAAFDRESALGRRSSISQTLDQVAHELSRLGFPAAARDADPESSSLAEQPYDLLVRALGGLDLARSSPAGSAGLSHPRPRELLVYLLCHPDGRTREQIGVDFWPEASSTQVKNSFHVLLHKLRKALGRHDLIVAALDRYRINPEAKVWFDVAEFERGLREAIRAGPDPEGLERSLALYRGDFLEGVSAGDWCLEIQERLRRIYLDGLSTLADLQIGNGNLAAAVATLERLMSKDELREEACRRLMTCLARAGRRDQALILYEEFSARLRSELGARPESATAALARRLSTAASD